MSSSPSAEIAVKYVGSWQLLRHSSSTLKPCHHSNWLLSPGQKHSPVWRQAAHQCSLCGDYRVLGWPWQSSSPHGPCELRSWLWIRWHCCPASYNSTAVISVNILSAQICQTLIDQLARKCRPFLHLIAPSNKACKGELTRTMSLLRSCETVIMKGGVKGWENCRA